MKTFDPLEVKKLYKPAEDSTGEDNGQVTIIGGSKLFHGAPLLSLKVASRIVDMVFFSSPEPSVGGVIERVKSKLFSFIWVPWNEVDSYIEKSNAVLIGPGFMRFGSEKTPEGKRNYSNHKEGQESRNITKRLLTKFPEKRWVIDAGSLQVMDADWIPKDAILTPNKKEFEMLFNVKCQMPARKRYASSVAGGSNVKSMADKHGCVIVAKDPQTVVCSPDECVEVSGGNAGLTKGGTGDVLAGLTVALLAKNEPLLAACSASYIAKAAADELYRKVGTAYNADDLAEKIPETFKKLIN